MDDLRVGFEPGPGSAAALSLYGRLRPGWCGNLASGLASRDIDIVRGHAIAPAPGAWRARFTLRRTPGVDPTEAELRHMLETDPGAGFTSPLELLGFALERSETRGGSLRLDIEARDRVGFLASLLRRLAFYALFPVELDLDTLEGRARDRLWLRGAGGTVPRPRTQAALDASLAALVRAPEVTGAGGPAAER